MLAVAQQRSVITPEHLEVVRSAMQATFGLDGAEIEHRLAYARHAASRSPSIQTTVDDLAPLLRERLTGAEQNELVAMLDQVAAVHGRPTYEQERVVALVSRRLRELH